MKWIMSLFTMILFVASTGIIVALPNVYQSPILVVIPIVLFLVFLFTLDIG